MKKILFALLCAFAVLATGCQEKEDTGITLSETEVTLNSAEKYQIAAESQTPITYTSENEYHATVDKQGLVTAMFVGETDIVLDNGEDTKKLHVIIEPKYNLYEEPVIDFGITKDELISMLGEPDRTDEDNLIYLNSSTESPMTLYSFENGKLSTSTVVVWTQYTENLVSFLNERYALLTEQEGTFLFMNGTEKSSATMSVLAYLYGTQYWMVMYNPYDATKSAAVSKDVQTVIQMLEK